MVKKEERIEFEISGSCSVGLMQAIHSRGWQSQESFSLAIKKGPIFSCLEKLESHPVGLFHIGCSSDVRPPSFEYTIKYGDIRQQLLVFSYQRIVCANTFGRENFFHDSCQLRDLEAVAQALSDPRKYTERIRIFWTGKDDKHEGLCQTLTLELFFLKNRLRAIRGFNEIQDDLFKRNIKGFEGSLLDLNQGPLRAEKDRFFNDLHAREWNALFRKYGIDIYDIIKEIYNLFQSSAPEFGKRKKIREALF